MSARPWLLVTLSTPIMGGVGLLIGIAARTLITATLSDAGITLSAPETDWAQWSDGLCALALAFGALLAGLSVHGTGLAGDRGFAPRRLATAAGAAILGASFAMAAAAAHVARTAVPATLTADILGAAPTVDVTTLGLPAWAASGVVGGLVIYSAMSTLSGLLGSDG